uniref:Uncharacterized protein n=1 Tax=Rhizophora mucronata TaxID=61149 RepID=A0A2P2PPZ2_RHIMU
MGYKQSRYPKLPWDTVCNYISEDGLVTAEKAAGQVTLVTEKNCLNSVTPIKQIWHLSNIRSIYD